MSKHIKKSLTKTTLAIVASVLLALIVVGGTVAFITDSTKDIKNIFKPSAVTIDIPEELEGDVKKDVRVKNTGDTDAYIRARVVVTWKDEQGNVSGIPVKDTDYTITYATGTDSKWFQTPENTDFWYYKDVVPAGEETGVLISGCKLAENVTPPEGYNLSVEIIAQGIQSEPPKAVKEAWKVVEVTDGILVPVTQ